MAEEALKRLEEQLNCSICLDTFTDPKLLQCFHVFCQQCLVPLGVRDQQGQLSVTCPTCRQVTPIPANGVTGLHSAFHINNLLEIQDSVQNIPNPPPAMKEAVGGPVVEENPSKNATEFCLEHVEEELKLHCRTCGELICYKCALKGGKHCNHDYEELDKAFEKYKEEIVKNIELMEKRVAFIKRSLALIKNRCGEISNQRGAIENSIRNTFKRLREVLTTRETELVRQLHQMTQGKLNGLAAQSSKIETTLAQLESRLRESIRAGKESDVQNIKPDTITQIKRIATPFKAVSFPAEPNTKANMTFLTLATLTTACEKYGQVLAVDVSLQSALVGVTSWIFVRAVNFEDKGCAELIRTILQCQIVSEITGSQISWLVERRGESQYDISYKPTIKGRHQIHIKLGGQHVRGSPLLTAIKSPVEKLGTPILTIDGVKGPRGVAVNQRGAVVVTEGNKNCISVFTFSGKKLRSFGTQGSGKGEFIDPRGVAVDREGNILVADNSNKRIQKFTVEGKFLATVDIKGPTDIAFNTSNNKVYVVDYISHQIQVLNSDLTFSSTFGNKGSDKGQFNGPWGIACDSTGKVYVTDLHNHRVQVFTAEGKFIRMFGRRGQDKGQLADPYFISVDTSGMVYVSECDNSRISVFTSEGRYVTSFGKKGAGPGEFNFQYGIAVDNSGVVYVCDSDNNRVLFF